MNDRNIENIGINAGIEEALKKQVTEEPIEKNYLTVPHGKATDNLAKISSRDANIDYITGTHTIDNGELKVVVRNSDKPFSLGINVSKLFYVAISQFANNNNFTKGENKQLNYDVSFSLDEYLKMLKYDITPHDETKREIERAKNARKNGIKALRKDLETLRNTEWSWEETIKGKAGDFVNISVIGSRGIRNGYVFMTIDAKMAEYLTRLPLTKYPLLLLGIDARNSNAYNIGLKLAEHYNNDNHIKKGTNNRIQIKNLLKATKLPTYEELQEINDSSHWDRRIRDPLENALMLLKDEGLLKVDDELEDGWKYVGPKARELTQEERADLSSYDKYINSYLLFEINIDVYDDRLIKKIANKEKTKKEPKMRQRKKH